MPRYRQSWAEAVGFMHQRPSWAGLWPLLLLASLVGGLLAFGLAAKEDRMPKRVSAWLLLALLNGIAFVGVFSNGPSA